MRIKYQLFSLLFSSLLCLCLQAQSPNELLISLEPTNSFGTELASIDTDGIKYTPLINDTGSVADVFVDLTNSQIYWGTAFEIIRQNLDGSNREVVITAGGFLEHYQVDLAGGKIYWSENVAGIRRANLDGTNNESILTGAIAVTSLALEATSGKLYYCDNTAGEIKKMNLDGSNIETVVATGGSAYSISLDLINDKVYWHDPFANMVRRANLDGTGSEDAFSTDMQGMFVDGSAQKIYFVDESTRRIIRSDLDGTDLEELVGPSSISNPRGIFVDLSGNRIYWADAYFDLIQRVDLDGNNQEILVAGTGDLSSIAADASTNKAYWSNQISAAVMGIDLDSTSSEIIFKNETNSYDALAIDSYFREIYLIDYYFFTGSKVLKYSFDTNSASELLSDSREFSDLALDLINQKIYLASPSEAKIFRCNLDGTNFEEFISNPVDRITLDEANGKIFWLNNTDHKIQSFNLDSSGTIEDIQTSLGDVVDLTIDRGNAKLYWSLKATGQILRSNLDGSEKETFLDGLDNPTLIEISENQLVDICRSNENKTEPGVCGCDIQDTDDNANSITDCLLKDAVYVQAETLLTALRKAKKLKAISQLRKLAKKLHNSTKDLGDPDLLKSTKAIKKILKRLRFLKSFDHRSDEFKMLKKQATKKLKTFLIDLQT